VKPLDSPRELSGSRKSERITAVAAVLTLFAVCWIASIQWFQLGYWGEVLRADEVEGAAVLASCLRYSEFVLEQHAAGLTPEQIDAVVTNAAVGGRPEDFLRGGIPMDVVCGTAQDVLTTVGRG